MSDIVVYGFAPSTFVRTARLALEEKGVDYELEAVDFGADRFDHADGLIAVAQGERSP